MTREEFEAIIGEEFPNAVPEKFHPLIKNLVFLVEDEPDEQTRREEGLGPHETLLGLYRGVPYPARGEGYGIGATLPDTITLYFRPLQEEAGAFEARLGLGPQEAMRKAVRETIWHEVAHHFGMDEHQVQHRENLRDLSTSEE